MQKIWKEKKNQKFSITECAMCSTVPEAAKVMFTSEYEIYNRENQV